jgi:hypothetical protein
MDLRPAKNMLSKGWCAKSLEEIFLGALYVIMLLERQLGKKLSVVKFGKRVAQNYFLTAVARAAA